MNKNLLLTSLASLMTLTTYSAQHIVSNSGTTFTPAEITIEPGDTVVFNIGSMHNAIEVSQDTYNANGNTSNGGFTVPFDGGSVSFPDAGTYYYVCEPHAEFGMKGIIHVEHISKTVTTIFDKNFEVFPNPANEFISINYNLEKLANVELSLISLTGREVLVLKDELQNAGKHVITSSFDERLSPGIYFVKLKAGDAVLVRKLLVE